MNTFLRQHLSFWALFLFVASTSVVAQQSDYQIQQNFREGLAELTQQVEQAESSSQLARIEEQINRFEERYSEHEEIINAAIYPETLERSIAKLRESHETAVANAEVIEDLNERLDEMMVEMAVFRNRINEMDREATELQQQIEEAEANERNQASLIRQYRQNIEQRDQFVSDFLEELLTRYRSMDRSTQEEIQEAAELLDENPLDVIRNILSEYISLADQSQGLDTPDYVAMRAQHTYFSDVWNSIGERLADTFSPDNPVQARQEVDDMLATWRTSVDNKLWNTITTAFNQNGIELEEFSSPGEFHTALNTYIDSAYQTSLEENSEEDYNVYRNFREFWNNTVKASWGEPLVEGGILTQSQIAAIDMKISDWGEASAPESNLMFILLLVSVAVIIGLVILLITKKN